MVAPGDVGDLPTIADGHGHEVPWVLPAGVAADTVDTNA